MHIRGCWREESPDEGPVLQLLTRSDPHTPGFALQSRARRTVGVSCGSFVGLLLTSGVVGAMFLRAHDFPLWGLGTIGRVWVGSLDRLQALSQGSFCRERFFTGSYEEGQCFSHEFVGDRCDGDRCTLWRARR